MTFTFYFDSGISASQVWDLCTGLSCTVEDVMRDEDEYTVVVSIEDEQWDYWDAGNFRTEIYRQHELNYE